MTHSCCISMRSLPGVAQAIGLALLFATPQAYGAEAPLPDVVVNDSKGGTKRIAEEDVYTFERDLQKLVAERNGPKEIFALATSASGDLLFPGGEHPDHVREMFIVLVFEKGGELRWLGSYGEKQRRWQLGGEQIKAIRESIKRQGTDSLPALVVPRIIGGKETMIIHGTIHVYLHVDAKECRRVFMNNPPIAPDSEVPPDDPAWKYTKAVEFFRALKKTAERRKEDLSKDGSRPTKNDDQREAE